MASHEHCQRCFVSKCSHTKGCPFVACHTKCGMSMHSCKLSDHSIVCPSELVCCVNAYYGCPAKLLRSRMNSHLMKCPANVITCTMEWGRYPLYSADRLKYVPFSQPNPPLVKGYLDVELAVRDQRVINMLYSEKYKKGLIKRYPERFYQKKASYERARVIKEDTLAKRKQSVEIQMETNEDNDGDDSTNQASDDVVIHESTNHVEICQNAATGNPSTSPENVPECPWLPDLHPGLGVNVNLETIPRFLKHNFMYSVPCSQLLQRREYAGHFKNVHSDIHAGMGWMDERCPLAQYGCSFKRNRLRPSSQEGAVIFSQHQGTFGIRPQTTPSLVHNDDNMFHLLWLPCEVLEVIGKWLDSYSLCNLALTCKTLYQVVHHMLPRRGIVVLQWKKRIYEDGSASWTTCGKSWLFTSAFTKVRQWVHADTPIMSSHMERCPYFKQYRPDGPFCYVTDNNINLP